MLTELRARALHLLLTLGLLIALAPSPVPGALVGRMLRATTALGGGHGAAAAVDLEAALELAPSSPQLQLAAAEAQWLAGQTERSLQLLGDLRADPATSGRAACLEAQIRLEAGDHGAGLDLLTGETAACLAEPALLGRIAQQLLAQGAWVPAERALELLISLQPESAWAQAQLGTLLATYRPMHAIGHLRLAVQLAPESAGAAPDLLRAVEDGLALDGESQALARVGQALAAAGQWGLARRALEGAVAADPEAAGAWALLGVALDQLGEEGEQAIGTATRLAPGSTQVQLLAARHWRGRGQFKRALEALEAAARLDPSDPVVASELASLYLALGDLRSAEAAYRHAVAVAPDQALFWSLLARFSLEHEVDVRSLGLPAARRAFQLAPEDGQAADVLAACHYLLGELHVAERLLWRALQLDPRLASAHYHRGLVLLALGDLAEAVRSLRQAQALDPGGRVGELASRSLANLPR